VEKLNNTNYFSEENEFYYIGHSQYVGFSTCQAKQLALISKEWDDEDSDAFLLGGYIDAYFEGTLGQYCLDHPEMFTEKHTLYAKYKIVNDAIKRVERDPFFMSFLSGKKQVVMTGEISGVPVKIKVDSYKSGECIVDLKYMKDFNRIFVRGVGRIPFVEVYGYDIEAAFYQEVVFQNTGEKLPFYIAGVTKEKEPDLAVIDIPQSQIDDCLDLIRHNIVYFNEVKNGVHEPKRCEECGYCVHTKKLSKIVSYREVGE
jgi:hypothetical protein